MEIERCPSDTQFYELDSSVRGFLDFWRIHGPKGQPRPQVQEETPAPPTPLITSHSPDKRAHTWFIHW